MTHKQFAIKIAKEAGRVIRQNFALGMKKEWKSNNTPVTVTDLKINKMVIEGVKKYFPTHDVLGEEESSLKNKSKFLWVCDPVDGTIPFSHGIPTCVFSLALVEDGKPILGVVCDPFMERMFFAELGKGAFLNGKKIKVSKMQLNEKACLSWEAQKEYPNKKGEKVFRFICIVYGGVLVACGEFVAAYYNWVYAHDLAALKIIVEEAGGKVTDMHGREQRYDGKINGGLITNGVVHEDMVNIIKKLKPQLYKK